MLCEAVQLLLRQPVIVDPVAVRVFCLEYDGPASREGSLKVWLSRFDVAGEKLPLPVRWSERSHGLRRLFNEGHALVLVPAEACGDHILEVFARPLTLEAPLAALDV